VSEAQQRNFEQSLDENSDFLGRENGGGPRADLRQPDGREPIRTSLHALSVLDGDRGQEKVGVF
jgi:hypothetical protein